MSRLDEEKDGRVKRGSRLNDKSATTRIVRYPIKPYRITTTNSTTLEHSIAIPEVSELIFPELSPKYQDTSAGTSLYCPMCFQFAQNGVTAEQVTPLLHALRRIVATIMNSDENMITYGDMMNQSILTEIADICNKITPRKPHPSTKEKFSWTEAFRKRADEAIYQLGVTKATPVGILKLIRNEFPNLTRQNVESYLQKARIRIRRGETLSHTSQTNTRSSETESSQKSSDSD